MIDEFSKFPVVIEVTTTAAHSVLPKLDNLFSMMGIPDRVKTDNGPPFQGEEISEFCKDFGISHRKITPAWAPANGQVENFNKNIKRVIQKSFVSKSDWRAELNSFLRAYRNTPHWSSKVAPFDLIFINSNSSKLPSLFQREASQESTKAKIARENDTKAKESMKS